MREQILRVNGTPVRVQYDRATGQWHYQIRNVPEGTLPWTALASEPLPAWVITSVLLCQNCWSPTSEPPVAFPVAREGDRFTYSPYHVPVLGQGPREPTPDDPAYPRAILQHLGGSNVLGS